MLKGNVYRHNLTSVFFPSVCIFCKGLIRLTGEPRADFIGQVLDICEKCLARLPFKEFKDHIVPCLSNPYDNDPIPDLRAVVPFRYQEPVVSALRALKFHDAPYVARALAFFMGEAIIRSGMTFDAVLPVPLSEERLRRRGYNQARLLAEPIAKKLNLPCPDGFLIRTRNTKQQSRYSDPARRSQNVSGAFTVPDRVCLDNLSVLLVDDVFTTGSTIHEAALTLYLSGARHVLALTAASGRHNSDDGSGSLSKRVESRSTKARK
jgi:ComF family protein